jgi:hypothetical protein
MMESTKQKLADYMEISERVDNNEEINPIDKFLLDNEPAGIEESEKFRKQLLEVINFEDAESKTERNTNVVASFMEHCKKEGIEIPDTIFESYFGM